MLVSEDLKAKLTGAHVWGTWGQRIKGSFFSQVFVLFREETLGALIVFAGARFLVLDKKLVLSIRQFGSVFNSSVVTDFNRLACHGWCSMDATHDWGFR